MTAPLQQLIDSVAEFVESWRDKEFDLHGTARAKALDMQTKLDAVLENEDELE